MGIINAYTCIMHTKFVDSVIHVYRGWNLVPGCCQLMNCMGGACYKILHSPSLLNPMLQPSIYIIMMYNITSESINFECSCFFNYVCGRQSYWLLGFHQGIDLYQFQNLDWLHTCIGDYFIYSFCIMFYMFLLCFHIIHE